MEIDLVLSLKKPKAQYRWTLWARWGLEVLKVVFVVASDSPQKMRTERGGEPWTVQWSCVAGTGAKLTFFTRGCLGTGGPGTEAGIRRGGLAETTEEEEKTGFSLSTETESDLSPTWRTKNFVDRWRTLYSIGTSVERGQRRFRSIVVDKNKLCVHQGSWKRLRLRQRNHIMSRRTRETQYCSFNIPYKTFWKKFRMFEELAW